jgi:TetR/AcrR family transcriptional regulator, transcriptional repressor of bet genes
MPRIVDHDSRRGEIAAAACSVIAQSGIDGMKLKDVGQAAGCTTGLITHYFEDKNAVLLAALDHAVTTMDARLERRLKRAPTDVVGFFSETLPIGRRGRDEIVVWYCFWARALNDPGLMRRQKAMHRRWRLQVERCLAAMAERGEIPPADDPVEQAEALCAIINGIGLRASLDPGEWPARRQSAQIRRYLDMLRGSVPTT